MYVHIWFRYIYICTYLCTYTLRTCVHTWYIHTVTHLITTLCSLIPLGYIANIPQLDLIKDRAENDEDAEPSA